MSATTFIILFIFAFRLRRKVIFRNVMETAEAVVHLFEFGCFQ